MLLNVHVFWYGISVAQAARSPLTREGTVNDISHNNNKISHTLTLCTKGCPRVTSVY